MRKEKEAEKDNEKKREKILKTKNNERHQKKTMRFSWIKHKC